MSAVPPVLGPVTAFCQPGETRIEIRQPFQDEISARDYPVLKSDHPGFESPHPRPERRHAGAPVYHQHSRHQAIKDDGHSNDQA